MLSQTLSKANDAVSLYDRVARYYNLTHSLWLLLAGRRTLDMLRAGVLAAAEPGAKVLEVGAGTGMVAAHLLALAPELQLTLLDGSPRMLAYAARLKATRIVGNALSLPFASNSFDIVYAAWVIETLGENGAAAVAEMRRVLKPGGCLLVLTCAAPDRSAARLMSWPIRQVVERFFAGSFLTQAHLSHIFPESAIAFDGRLSISRLLVTRT